MVSHSESGLVVPTDGRALACSDFNGDGRPDFLVGINNGELLAFTNRRTPAAGVLRLQGKGGNPSVAGARVTLVSKDGRRVQEVYQGGGYLSQSTPTIFLDPDVIRVEVVWPSGASSTHPVDPATPETVISGP